MGKYKNVNMYTINRMVCFVAIRPSATASFVLRPGILIYMSQSRTRAWCLTTSRVIHHLAHEIMVT